MKCIWFMVVLVTSLFVVTKVQARDQEWFSSKARLEFRVVNGSGAPVEGAEVDGYFWNPYKSDTVGDEFTKKTHCVIVFVSVDEAGKSQKVNSWIPRTERELQLENYAKKLKNLRQQISEEMKPFF